MEINELVKTVRPYSMATEERLTWMAETAKMVVESNIPGDFAKTILTNFGRQFFVISGLFDFSYESRIKILKFFRRISTAWTSGCIH